MGTDEMLNKSFAQLQRAKERGLFVGYVNGNYFVSEHGEISLMCSEAWLAKKFYIHLRDMISFREISRTLVKK